ncbi:hypothetical protein QYM36_015019 [Artemia franciscana]|nr:hypothetical protein QYM36_015019 [Artemia franciscana]
MTLAVLAWDRSNFVRKPSNGYSYGWLNTGVLIAFVWVYALAVMLPPVLGWGEFTIEGIGVSCAVNWEATSYNAKTYGFYLITTGLLVPLTIIIYSYTFIIMTIQRAKVGNTAISSGVRIRRTRQKAEARATIMIACMIAGFLLAWGPYAIMSSLVLVGAKESLAIEATIVPLLMAKTSVLYDPILYAAFNTQLQKSWMSLFGCASLPEQQKNSYIARKRKSPPLVNNQSKENSIATILQDTGKEICHIEDFSDIAPAEAHSSKSPSDSDVKNNLGDS